MPFEFGDVVLVPFPFTSQIASKKRPAVVVSGRAYNTAKPDVIVMAITSQVRANAGPGEVWLQDWKAAGLLKPSAANSPAPTAKLCARPSREHSDHKSDQPITCGGCTECGRQSEG